MASTYELIQSYTATGSVANIDFTSIPATYTDLVLHFSIRTAKSAVNENIFLSFNGSTTSFSARWFYGDGTTTGNSTTGRIGGFGDGNTATASTFGSSYIYIPNYASTSSYKSYSGDAALENNATLAYAGLIAGLWSSNSAINQITLTPESGSNILQYSSAYLYGVKNA